MKRSGIVFILLTTAVLCIASGVSIMGMVVFPAAIAYFWVRKEYLCTGALLVGSLVAPLVGGGDDLLVAVFGVSALTGIFLGYGMHKGLSLGPAIAVASVLLFSAITAYTVLIWQDINANWQQFFEVYRAQFQAMPPSDNVDLTLKMISWMELNWPYVLFGFLFGFFFLASTVTLSNVYRHLAVVGLIEPKNYKFSVMRTPEHLVWLAIALAGLWFWDNSKPNDWIRFISWNGAIALAVVYWVNGLSIGVYAVQVFSPRPIIVFVMLLLVIFLNIHQLFAVVGFFDTWWNFRWKIRQFVDTREANRQA